MSRQSRAPSHRTAPTEHYFYGSTQSIASADAHAPSVFIPNDNRVGIWVSQTYPVPPTHVSRAPSHHSGPGGHEVAPHHSISVRHQVAPSHHSAGQQVQASSTYARSQTWESQGLAYPQSNRSSVYFTQVSSGSSAPAEYFLDVRGNYINIATCPADVLKSLKKEKLELQQLAEQQTLRAAAGAKERAMEYAKRVGCPTTAHIYVETIIPTPAPAPEKQSGSAFKRFVKEYHEAERFRTSAPTTYSDRYY